VTPAIGKIVRYTPFATDHRFANGATQAVVTRVNEDSSVNLRILGHPDEVEIENVPQSPFHNLNVMGHWSWLNE